MSHTWEITYNTVNKLYFNNNKRKDSFGHFAALYSSYVRLSEKEQDAPRSESKKLSDCSLSPDSWSRAGVITITRSGVVRGVWIHRCQA